MQTNESNTFQNTSKDSYPLGNKPADSRGDTNLADSVDEEDGGGGGAGGWRVVKCKGSQDTWLWSPSVDRWTDGMARLMVKTSHIVCTVVVVLNLKSHRMLEQTSCEPWVGNHWTFSNLSNNHPMDFCPSVVKLLRCYGDGRKVATIWTSLYFLKCFVTALQK